MAESVSLTAERRTETGKGAARKLRSRGRIPAVIYGHGRDPQALSVSAMELDKALQGISAESTIIDLAVDGAGVQALIREIQRHPTRMSITHLDFYEIHAGEKITLDVPVRLVGAPEGVRNAGGVLEQFLREVEIEVLPSDIPDHVDVDVTDLSVAQSLHVADLSIPNAKILSDPDQTICTVVPPRVEEAPPVEVFEEVEAAEPELIRKARGEAEEEEEAAAAEQSGE